jgi:N-hydroxyarylamine O-acetyltransferase
LLEIDIVKYLNRIHYKGEIIPSLQALKIIQRAHLMNVPFENLDIHRKVSIDITNLFEKIVFRNRGGFCYELNGLFYELLKQIGFDVKLISARVYEQGKGFGPEFDHMSIIARINGLDYLVDAGFGDFALQPLEIKLDKELKDPAGIFKIIAYNDQSKLVQKKSTEGEFIPQYLFTEIARNPNEFNEMCLYHQTSSQSHFTQKRICTLPLENGRITLTGNTLKVTRDHAVTTKPCKEEEIPGILWEYFKIKL